MACVESHYGFSIPHCKFTVRIAQVPFDSIPHPISTENGILNVLILLSPACHDPIARRGTLIHECTHCLFLVKKPEVNYLEEGAAEYLACLLVPELNPSPDLRYVEAHGLVRELIHARPDAIPRLREIQPSLSIATESNILQIVPDFPPDKTALLTRKFYPPDKYTVLYLADGKTVQQFVEADYPVQAIERILTQRPGIAIQYMMDQQGNRYDAEGYEEDGEMLR